MTDYYSSRLASSKKVVTNMAEGESKTYGPPKIPNTPSNTINNMLQTRCGKPQDNVVKAAVTFIICYVFQGITMVYNMVHPDKNQPSHKMWMASCGAISGGIVLAAYLCYNIIIGCSFIFHAALYYTALLIALVGIGLGASGMVFFDKEGYKPATSPASNYLYEERTSTHAASSTTYSGNQAKDD